MPRSTTRPEQPPHPAPEGGAGPATAALLIIGNEVLSGRTQDVHLQHVASWLGERGIVLREARVIPDEVPLIVQAVQAGSAAYGYLLTTGGIGPTHDDVTAEAVALAFGLPLEQNEEAVAALRAHYGPEPLNAARLRMARVPRGAALIHNPVSGAPGFQVGNVFVLAGVPRIMRAMLQTLAPRLRGGRPLVSRSLSAFCKESDLAAPLAALQLQHPRVQLGSYPFQEGGRFGVTIVARAEDPEALERAAQGVQRLLQRADP